MMLGIFFGMQMQTNSLVSTKNLAKMLNVDKAIIYRLVQEKRITAYKVGGRYRFDAAEVLDALRLSATQIEPSRVNVE